MGKNEFLSWIIHVVFSWMFAVFKELWVDLHFFGGGRGFALGFTVHVYVLNFMALKLPDMDYSIGKAPK